MKEKEFRFFTRAGLGRLLVGGSMSWGLWAWPGVVTAQDGGQTGLRQQLAQAVQQRNYERAAQLQSELFATIQQTEPGAKEILESSRARLSRGVEETDQGYLLFRNRYGAEAKWDGLAELRGSYELGGKLTLATYSALNAGVLLVELIPRREGVENQRQFLDLNADQVRGGRMFRTGPLQFGAGVQGLRLSVFYPRRDSTVILPVHRDWYDELELVTLNSLELVRVPPPVGDWQPLRTLEQQYHAALGQRLLPLMQQQRGRLEGLLGRRRAQGDQAGATRVEAALAELTVLERTVVANGVAEVTGGGRAALVLDAEQASRSSEWLLAYGQRVSGFYLRGEWVSWDLRELRLPTTKLKVRLELSLKSTEQGVLKLSIPPQAVEFELAKHAREGSATLETEVWNLLGTSPILRIEYDPKVRPRDGYTVGEGPGLTVERVELLPVD